MSQVTDQQREEFFQAFVAAMVWLGTDDNENPMDENHSEQDINPGALTGLKDDCNAFIDQNADLLLEAVTKPGYTFANAGHDYLLSRNGHGAGFFDRDLDEVGDKLQEASQDAGTVDAYVGDDGQIYVSGLETPKTTQARKPKP